MRLVLLGLAMLMAAPAQAEDTAAGRLAAFVTNRYLDDFAGLREDIARLEVLRACGDQETLIPFLDRVVAAELELRRGLIAQAEALEAENLPPPGDRRALVTSLLDAFSATDATAREMMLDAAMAPRPAEAVCERTRAEVLERLETPQPTGLKP